MKSKKTLSLSNRLQGTNNQKNEDSRSLLNTSRTENSEVTIKTARLIYNEIATQNIRKLYDLKECLESLISEAVNTANGEKMLLSIQNALRVEKPGLYTKVDHRSDELNGCPGEYFFEQNQEKLWRTTSKFGSQGTLF